MSAELVDQSINVTELKDGQIAIITSWPGDCEGRIVQRYNCSLITLGNAYGKSWPNLYKESKSNFIYCKVRVLKDGELIKVTNN